MLCGEGYPSDQPKATEAEVRAANRREARNKKRRKEQRRAAHLAALKAAVVAAAKLVDGQYASLIKHGRASRALCDLHAACAALAQAEEDGLK